MRTIGSSASWERTEHLPDSKSRPAGRWLLVAGLIFGILVLGILGGPYILDRALYERIESSDGRFTVHRWGEMAGKNKRLRMWDPGTGMLIYDAITEEGGVVISTRWELDGKIAEQTRLDPQGRNEARLGPPWWVEVTNQTESTIPPSAPRSQ